MRLVLLGVALLASGGCSTSVRLSPDFEREGDLCAGVDCGAGASCVDGQCVPTDPCLGVSCDRREVCVDGTCVSERFDADGDGFPARDDCDDHDPNIIPGSQRDCSSDCGRGQQTCMAGGRWSRCSVPTECDCTPGDENQEPCGNCGEAVRVCGPDGTWSQTTGPCENERACSPGITRFERCGDPASCGAAEVVCQQDCTWGDPSTCEASPECTPGDTTSEACGQCGVRTQVCTEDCVFGPHGDCEGEGPCSPGDTDTQPCGRCGQQVSTCNDQCQWEVGACQEPVGVECAPNQGETQSCGCVDAAIEEARSCRNDCTWTPWSGCPCACEVVLAGGVRICETEQTTVTNACGDGVDAVGTCVPSGGGHCDVQWQVCVPEGL